MSASGGTQAVDVVEGAGALTQLAVAATGAAGAVVATLPAAVGKTTFITGFSCTAAGSTAGAVVNVAITGIANTLAYVFTFPAGVGLAANNLVVNFPDPVPATAVNTAVAVTLPSGGAGNTAAAVTAHGYQA